MQNTDLNLLTFEEDLARGLVGLEHHFRSMDQPFHTGFDAGKRAVGHDTGDDSVMDRIHREIGGSPLPWVGSDPLQTESHSTSFRRNIQHLDDDLFTQLDDLTRMRNASPR